MRNEWFEGCVAAGRRWMTDLPTGPDLDAYLERRCTEMEERARKLDIVVTCPTCRTQGIVTAAEGIFRCPCGTDTTREEVRKALDETWDEDEASMRYLADR